MKCRWTAFVLVLCMVAAVMVPAAAEDLSAAPAQSQIERIVVSYADSGTRDDRALEALSVPRSAPWGKMEPDHGSLGGARNGHTRSSRQPA